MTKKEKNINKKNLCDKYGVKITISEVLTDEYESNKVYFPKKLAEANAVMRKVCLPKEFFAEKETTKEMQIA